MIAMNEFTRYDFMSPITISLLKVEFCSYLGHINCNEHIYIIAVIAEKYAEQSPVEHTKKRNTVSMLALFYESTGNVVKCCL